MRRRNHEFVWRRVHWPQPLETVEAIGLLQQIASDATRGAVVFEVHASGGHVRYLLGCTPSAATRLTATLTNLVHGTVVEEGDRSRRPVSASTRLRVDGAALRLLVDHPRQTSLALLTALGAATRPTDEVVLQLVLGRGIPPRAGAASDRDPTQSTLALLVHGARKPSTAIKKALESKQTELAFVARARVGARANSEQRVRTLVAGVLAALRTIQSPGTRVDLVRDRSDMLNEAILPSRGNTVLTCSEVLAISGWPIELETAPGLPENHPKPLALDAREPDTSRVFAHTTAPGEKRPLGINIDDARFHTVLTGPTGTGKSTALLNLIHADLKAGRGIVVIDPKSDLVVEILKRIPANRSDDIVVLDPTDERPVGLNPLASTDASRELVADGILAVFRGLFPSMFGPRTSDVLHASLLSLSELPGATLAWLPRLLTDRAFRARHLAAIDDEALGGFWANFESLSVAQQAQFIGPVLSRLRQFLLRPSLRRVLDQPVPRFDLARIFTDQKILLVPLNTGLLGATASRLLGSLLVTQLWQLTLARARVNPHARTPVSIYVDEAQEFLRLDSDLADALARSRALGVAWHLAHQYRDQFDAATRAAVDANARNKITFTLGAKDAKDMAAFAPELKTQDFMALPQFHVYAQLVCGGHPQRWVSGKTLPAPERSSDSEHIIVASQERWGAEPDASRHSGSQDDGDDVIGRRPRLQS